MIPDRAPDHAVAVTRPVDPDACRCLCHTCRRQLFHFSPCCRPCGDCGERIRADRVAAHADGCRRPETSVEDLDASASKS